MTATDVGRGGHVGGFTIEDRLESSTIVDPVRLLDERLLPRLARKRRWVGLAVELASAVR